MKRYVVSILTSFSLSTIVTSAQKFAIDIAIVLPKNPSDGFPISPTLKCTQIVRLHISGIFSILNMKLKKKIVYRA